MLKNAEIINHYVKIFLNFFHHQSEIKGWSPFERTWRGCWFQQLWMQTFFRISFKWKCLVLGSNGVPFNPWGCHWASHGALDLQNGWNSTWMGLYSRTMLQVLGLLFSKGMVVWLLHLVGISCTGTSLKWKQWPWSTLKRSYLLRCMMWMGLSLKGTTLASLAICKIL